MFVCSLKLTRISFIAVLMIPLLEVHCWPSRWAPVILLLVLCLLFGPIQLLCHFLSKTMWNKFGKDFRKMIWLTKFFILAFLGWFSCLKWYLSIRKHMVVQRNLELMKRVQYSRDRADMVLLQWVCFFWWRDQMVYNYLRRVDFFQKVCSRY